MITSAINLWQPCTLHRIPYTPVMNYILLTLPAL